MKHTHEYEIQTGEELLADNISELDGLVIKKGMIYKVPYPVMIGLNHYRNLKKEFKKHGDAGIIGYCTAVYAHQQAEKKEAK